MDWLVDIVVAAAGIALIVWALRAGRSRGAGLSDADRYQQELARKSRQHNDEQVARALALKPANPAGRTGYSGSAAYRTSPAQGQNVTHGQNFPGAGAGQNAGFPGSQQPGSGLNPQLMMQVQAMARSGQKVAAVRLLRAQAGLGLVDAKNLVDRL
ncbi:MAG: hypothetical protein ACHP7K_01365 [Actinomycetales bacterium]